LISRAVLLALQREGLAGERHLLVVVAEWSACGAGEGERGHAQPVEHLAQHLHHLREGARQLADLVAEPTGTGWVRSFSRRM